MKNSLLYLLLFLTACNNSSEPGSKTGDSLGSTTETKEKKKSSGSGCAVYYWFRKGSEAEFSMKDGTGKETFHSKTIVTNVHADGGATVADFTTSTGTGHQINASYRCEGDRISVDMKSFLGNTFSGLAKGGIEMEIESAYLSFPLNMKEGDDLEGTKFKIVAKKDGKPMMTTTSEIKNRKVEAAEKITTPAGSWSCLRISETNVTTSEMMGKQINARETKNTYWLAPGFGIVKYEYYNKDGSVSMVGELVSLKN